MSVVLEASAGGENDCLGDDEEYYVGWRVGLGGRGKVS